MCLDDHTPTSNYDDLVALGRSGTQLPFATIGVFEVAKARSSSTRSRLIARHNNALASRANALSGAILGWLQRYARRALREVNARLDGGGIAGLARSKLVSKCMDPVPACVAKKDPEELTDIERELWALFAKYGLEQVKSSGTDAARASGVSSWEATPELFRRINRELANKVVLIARDTEAGVRDSLKRIIDEAMAEKPTPTPAELGRRIAREWLGPPSKRVPMRGSAREQQVTADWRRTQEDIDAGGREYLFGYARAHTIARTELGKIRTAASAEAYADCGVEEVEWLSAGNDGRSGERRHYLMNGKTIPVAAMNGDSSEWFRLPNGERTPYPMWSGLSAGQVVNCRCVLIPRISR